MPELGSDAEPTRLLLVMRSTDEAKSLMEALKLRMPELRVDQAEGVVSGLAHLFESPPDILLIDATMPGIDATVLCRELGGLAVSSRLRVIVGRPTSMSTLDDAMREAGAWSVLDSPITADEICDSLALGNYDLARTKAS
jgi:PleD family two-component response regulator